MKKLLTLIIALGAVVAVMAQQGRHYPSGRGSNDVILGQSDNRSHDNDRRYGTYSFTERERDVTLRRIDREFDQKIRQVQRSRFLNGWEKRRQIESLEREKAYEIRKVNERFYDRRNIHRDNRYDRNRRY